MNRGRSRQVQQDVNGDGLDDLIVGAQKMIQTISGRDDLLSLGRVELRRWSFQKSKVVGRLCHQRCVCELNQAAV